MMSPLFRLATAALAACCCATHAAAAIFCVGNEIEFRQALNAAAANNQDDSIRLRSGTYFTGGQKFSITTAEARDVAISGGWIDEPPQSCARQAPSASATALDGQNLTPVLEINVTAPGASNLKTITIINLTLRNGYTTRDSESAALRVEASDRMIHLERVIMSRHDQQNFRLNGQNSAIALFGSGDMHVINNGFQGIVTRYAGFTTWAQRTGQLVYVNNNTFSIRPTNPMLIDYLAIHNYTQSGAIDYRFINNAMDLDSRLVQFHNDTVDVPSRVWLYNNIGSWGGTERLLGPTSIEADIGSRTDVEPATMFVSTNPLDPRPAAGSPLANAGLAAPAGGYTTVDLDGNPRVDLGGIDVGAWESTRERIFTDGFD